MSLKQIHKHYEGRVHPDRENHDILDWSSREEQHCRFEVLHRILQEEDLAEFSHLSLLDVGCGMGDLRTFLLPRLPGLDYVGVDVTPAVLREARRRQPDARFVLGDVFARAPFSDRLFDVVFCSGVFNLNLGNNVEFMRSAIPALFRLCRQCVVANFLHARTADKYPHCHYYQPDAIRQAVPRDASRVRVVDDYLHKDFTLLIRR